MVGHLIRMSLVHLLLEVFLATSTQDPEIIGRLNTSCSPGKPWEPKERGVLYILLKMLLSLFSFLLDKKPALALSLF